MTVNRPWANSSEKTMLVSFVSNSSRTVQNGKDGFHLKP